jgi:predicted MFS family arabinose efflux permease
MKQSSPPLPTAPFTAYQKLVIALLALLQFTVVLDFMVLAPLGDFLMKSLAIGPQQFGVVVSAYAFSAGAAGILAAGFADRFDRKQLLIFFYTGFIVGTLGCALASSYALLLTARIVTGLFGGVIGAVSMAIVADLFPPQQRGRVMGISQMGFAASQVLGIPIGLYLASHWGWHSTFFMIVGLALLIAVTIVTRLRPIKEHLALQTDKSPFVHLWHTLMNRSYQVGFAATALLTVGGFMLMPFGSAFLINNLRIAPAQLPIVYLSTGAASIITMPLIGKLSDRVDKFRLFLAGSALAVVMILFYTSLGPTPLWAVLLVNVVLFAGVMSRMIPLTTLTSTLPDAQDRGAFMSINASLQQMAGGVSAVAAGLLVAQPHPGTPLEHYNQLGMVVAAVIVLCCFPMYRMSVHVGRKMAAAVPA